MRENGKSSMGAVVEQIQQTYDLQVKWILQSAAYLDRILLFKGEYGLLIWIKTKSSLKAWQKESESTLIFLPGKWKGNNH